MLRELLDSRRATNAERGQVMIIFAFAFVVIIMLMALLFDGGRALVLRRELKNASDAAAMAGANIIQSLSPKGCSLDPTSPDERAEVRAAVEASVAANLPGYDPAAIQIDCANGNSEVWVQLGDQAPTFFGSIFNSGPLDVGVTSAAINGQDAGNQYSVILLDNGNLGWPVGRRGCPSFLLSGGPTVIFDSSIYIDSTCTRANGGALSTNGNSATLTLGSNGPQIRLTGEYAPGSLVINPPPVEGVAPKPDPLASRLYQPSWWTTPVYTPPLVDNRPPGSTAFLGTNPTGLVVRRNAKLIINGSTQVLEPGVYKGGIELRSSAVAILHPGVYVLQGGGLKLGAQSSLYSVDYSVNTVPTNWATSCGNDTCGVMIYNTGDQSGSGALGQIDISAGATFKVRSYEATANSPTSVLNNGTHFSNTDYNQMLFWQSADPQATSTYGQPDLRLNGGGNVEMIGTVYAPQAKVQIGGTSGGSGGAQVNLTLQFIVWDMELSGNATFHFVYDGNEFVVPPSYGLTE